MKIVIAIMLMMAANVYAATVSMNIPSINIADAVRLLARYAEINVIVSPDVQGSDSLHVKNAKAVDMLKTFLLMHGLEKIEQGNVWYVAPRSALIKSGQEESEWRSSVESAAPLLSQLWKLRYARADEMATIMQNDHASLLSERGHMSVDARTNQIFIRDTSERLAVVSRLIHRLDIPIQQVQVEARLVSIDQDAERQLGFDFTVRQPSGDASAVSGMQIAADARGKYSIAIAKLPDGSMLDIKLAALEQQGRAELISSPSLFTGSQQEASIEAGEEVPYQEVSESGGTAVAFKKAVLGLKVTPQVLPGGQLLLALKINQDRPAARMVQGVPAISTRQIVTNVQMKSGQTVVLGGIYELNHEQTQHGIPILGNIPIIGLLFTQQARHDKKRELLIFVTPKIMPQAI